MNLSSFQKTNYKERSLIVASFFIVGAIALLYLVIKPTIRDVKNLRLEILAQKIEIEKSINKEKNKSKLSSALKKIEPQLEQFNKIFINRDRDLEFITTLEGLADKHKLNQTISLDTRLYDSKKTYSIIPISLSVTGKFENIIQYLSSLESSSYYIKTTSFAMSKAESIDNETIINLNLSANTYWK